MQYRRLGQSDLNVSIIGLGTLASGGRAYGAIDERDAIAAIQHALELGINLIDTSDNYGLGRAEEIVGKAIQGRRDTVILATKGGTPWDEQGRIRSDCSEKAITQAVEGSLRRLNVDVIDLYQVHVPDPSTPFEETANALERLVQAGKIRYVGVSNFWPDDLREWLEHGTVVSNQMPYNLLHRDVEQELLPLCIQHAIGLIAYTPLLMGLLAGRVTPETEFGTHDHRAHYPQFEGEPLSQTLVLLDCLRPIAAASGMTLAQLALAWITSRPGVTCAIPGARNTQQVEENAAAGDRSLNPAQTAQIDHLLADVRVATPRWMSTGVITVHKGPRGKKIGLLAWGVAVQVPDTVQAGDTVQVDIVTGRVAAGGYTGS